MKKHLSLLAAFTLLAGTSRAEIITQWNFNSQPPGGGATTGSLVPSAGNGTATEVGGIAVSFSTGSDTDTNSDNSGWHTTSYPSRTTLNKTAGVQFAVSTLGFTNLTISFEARHTATASRYVRLQYTLNGADFVDGPVLTLLTSNTYVAQTFSLADVPGTANNVNFAVRLVTEFESTATGAGANAYVATGSASSYSTAGTIRYDLVTIAGDLINPDNTPPTISDIADAVTVENIPAGPIDFIIDDLETLPDNLRLVGASSNTNLVTVGGIVFGGDGIFRNVTITPESGHYGTALITITVTDEGGRSTNETFTLVVTPANLPPTISKIGHQTTYRDTATPAIGFTLGDVETSPENLVVTRSSSNPALAPLDNILLGGTGPDRTVSLTPAAGEVGTSLITLTVADEGGRQAATAFVLMVLPSPDSFFCESFGYEAGPLTTNSAFFWTNHSGTSGQLQAGASKIALVANQTEDVHALIGSFVPADGGSLYASFTVNFATLPSSGGTYFAHFNHNDFRGRIFASSTNAATGGFRLGIANSGSTGNSQWPVDLMTHSNYTVVTRYVVNSGITTLWVNPVAESAAGVTDTDTVTPVTINSWSFRQNSGSGNLVVSDFKLGHTFASVVPGAVATLPSLTIRLVAGPAVEVVWPAAADFTLQSAASLVAPDWQDYPDAPMTTDNQNVVTITNPDGAAFFRLIRRDPVP